MAMLKPGMDMDLLGELEEAREKWKFTELEHFDSEECDKLVQSLADSVNGQKHELAKMMINEIGPTIASTREKFRSNIVHGSILSCLLEKVYVTPDHHDVLRPLFDSIDIDGEGGGKKAYFALDTVRMVLRYVIVREAELGEVRRKILDVCYDTMLKVAKHNGLVRLAKLMDGDDAREEFCGDNAEMIRMAMLHVSVYDKRDIPPDDGICGILNEYPALEKMLGTDNVIKSKSRITQLIHHISANYLVKHDDYEKIYTAVYESNIRIRYWINQIYICHDDTRQPPQNDTERAMRQPSLQFLNVLSSIRYLALEVFDFLEIYESDHHVVDNLKLDDPGGFYKIMRGRGEVKNTIGKMRREFGAHPIQTFEEISEQVNAIGLDTLVLYVRLTLLFQDAVFRTIPSRYHRDENLMKQEFIPISWSPVTKEDVRVVESTYDGVSMSLNEGDHQRTYVTMYESLLCMSMLNINFTNVSEKPQKETLDILMKFSSEVYNTKYMILELANFVEQYEELAPKLKTKAGEELIPNFLKRKEKYRRLRNHYSAHARFGDIVGIQQVMRENPNLISEMLQDIQEAWIIVTKMQPEFQEYKACAVPLMSDMEMDGVDREIDRIHKESNEYYENRYVEIQTMIRRCKRDGRG